jgi:2-aminoethylphosphonate-pyruvate transaminase
LIIENGAYGQRMVKMCRVLNIPYDVVSFDEIERVKVDTIADKLKTNEYTHVAIVHCETSSGILNPIEEIGQLVYNHGTTKGSLTICTIVYTGRFLFQDRRYTWSIQ